MADDLLLPAIDPPRRTPEEVARIKAQATGPIIHNVVACAADLSYADAVLPLAHIAWLTGGMYNKGGFSSPCTLPVIALDRKATLLMFYSAKFVLTGAPNEHAALALLYATLRFVYEKTGIVLTPQNFRITNIQSVVHMYAHLNLGEIHRNFLLTCNAQYEPDAIPHVKLTLPHPRVTVLVHAKGNLVLTGASRREELVEAMKLIVDRLAHFVVGIIDDPKEKADIAKDTEKLLAKLDKPVDASAID
jgi:transcription initiation factor TFIID TATA-box-binding protein